MKKTALKTILALIFLLMIITPLFFAGQGGVGFVWAQTGINQAITGLDETAGHAGLSGNKELIPLVGQIIRTILGFLGIVFVILLLYGGYLRMTAQGTPDKIKQSTGIITSAIVGVVIILASYIITSFVFSQIEGTVGSGSGGGVSENCDNTQCDQECKNMPNSNYSSGKCINGVCTCSI